MNAPIKRWYPNGGKVKTEEKRGIIAMDNALRNCYQRFNAEGKIILKAEAPPEFEILVAETFQLPGIVTIKPIIDFKKFNQELLAKHVPREIAQTITASLGLLEDEAYFGPDKGFSIKKPSRGSR